MKSGLAAGQRPFRCYRLNVKSETAQALISGLLARQLHITDNFTLINIEDIQTSQAFDQLARGAVGERGIHFVE